MKKDYKNFLAWMLAFCSYSAVNAQTATTTPADTIKKANSSYKDVVDGGLRIQKSWRNTGAVFTLSGEDLTRMTSGNLLNTLQGRIPGLTVVTGSGEPGYDNPTFYMRGQSSWHSYRRCKLAGNSWRAN